MKAATPNGIQYSSFIWFPPLLLLETSYHDNAARLLGLPVL
jgi:hypothetical protein